MLGQHLVDPSAHQVHVVPRLVFDRIGLARKRYPKLPLRGADREQDRDPCFQGIEFGGDLFKGGHGAILTPPAARRDNSFAAWALATGVMPA